MIMYIFTALELYAGKLRNVHRERLKKDMDFRERYVQLHTDSLPGQEQDDVRMHEEVLLRHKNLYETAKVGQPITLREIFLSKHNPVSRVLIVARTGMGKTNLTQTALQLWVDQLYFRNIILAFQYKAAELMPHWDEEMTLIQFITKYHPLPSDISEEDLEEAIIQYPETLLFIFNGLSKNTYADQQGDPTPMAPGQAWSTKKTARQWVTGIAQGKVFDGAKVLVTSREDSKNHERLEYFHRVVQVCGFSPQMVDTIIIREAGNDPDKQAYISKHVKGKKGVLHTLCSTPHLCKRMVEGVGKLYPDGNADDMPVSLSQVMVFDLQLSLPQKRPPEKEKAFENVRSELFTVSKMAIEGLKKGTLLFEISRTETFKTLLDIVFETIEEKVTVDNLEVKVLRFKHISWQELFAALALLRSGLTETRDFFKHDLTSTYRMVMIYLMALLKDNTRNYMKSISKCQNSPGVADEIVRHLLDKAYPPDLKAADPCNQTQTVDVANALMLVYESQNQEVVDMFSDIVRQRQLEIHLDLEQDSDHRFRCLVFFLEKYRGNDFRLCLENRHGSLLEVVNHIGKMEELRLVECEMSDTHFKCFIDTVKSNTSLKKLGLVDCRLGRWNASQIADLVIKQNTNITHLDLSLNYLGDQSMKYIADSLEVNQKLVKISLSRNCITEKGAKCLLNSLSINQRVEVLLNYNKIYRDVERNNRLLLGKQGWYEDEERDEDKYGYWMEWGGRGESET